MNEKKETIDKLEFDEINKSILELKEYYREDSNIWMVVGNDENMVFAKVLKLEIPKGNN